MLEILEIKVTLDAPGLSAALEKLADALMALRIPEVPATVEEVDEPADEAPVGSAANPIQIPVEPVESAPASNAPTTSTASPTPAPATAPKTAAPTVSTVAVEPPVEAEKPKVYTLDDIANAMAGLIDAGKMAACMETIKKYGVPAINLLKPEQYPSFVEDLRALGAKL